MECADGGPLSINRCEYAESRSKRDSATDQRLTQAGVGGGSGGWVIADGGRVFFYLLSQAEAEEVSWRAKHHDRCREEEALGEVVNARNASVGGSVLICPCWLPAGKAVARQGGSGSTCTRGFNFFRLRTGTRGGPEANNAPHMGHWRLRMKQTHLAWLGLLRSYSWGYTGQAGGLQVGAVEQ